MVSAQQMNLLPKSALRNDAIFAQKVYRIYATTSQYLSSYGCAITMVYIYIYIYIYIWQQCSQRQPGVCMREKHHSHCYPVSSLIFFFFFLLLLPTNVLCASSTWHRTPTDPSHTRGSAEVSEPLGTECWWHSNSYSIWGNEIVSPMYKHSSQCHHFATGPYICI